MTEHKQIVYSSAHFAVYAAKKTCEEVLKAEYEEISSRSEKDESKWQPTDEEVAESMAYIQEKPATDEQILMNKAFLLGFNAGMDAEEIFRSYLKENEIK